MADSNAYATLTRDQEGALIGVRIRLTSLLDDLARDDGQYFSRVGTMQDIEELEHAFPVLFGPDSGLREVLPHFHEGC